MHLLAELLSKHHVLLAGVSKKRRNAWSDLQRTTQAITADTSLSQLQSSVDGGLRARPKLSEQIPEHCGVELLQCAHLNGCSLPYRACFKAAAQEQPQMIQWALDEQRRSSPK